MKNAFFFAIGFLVVGLLYQAYLLVTIPSSSIELLLNEKTYYDVLNEADFETLNKVLRSTVAETKNRQWAQKAHAEAENMLVVATVIKQELKGAQLWRNNSDSIDKRLDQLLFTVDSLPKEMIISSVLSRLNMSQKITSPKHCERAGEHYGLALASLESDLLAALTMSADSLAMYASAMSIRFDIIRDIKTSEGPAWVKGQIAFNAPNQMRLQQKERIQVRISKKYSNEILASMSSQESVVSDSLPVGNIMMVKLMGEDFDIVAFDDEEQGVTNDGYTQWEFEVTPKSSGKHELFVKVGIVYYVPNLGPTKKSFPVYEKAIQVEVSTWQVVAAFATERWEFIISTIVIPAGVWGYSRIRTRRKSRSEHPKDEIAAK
jgi:hypothetical protein